MEKRGTILIIDDDQDILFTAKTILKSEFNRVFTLTDPSMGEAVLSENDIDIVILDMNFSPGKVSGEEGIAWLRRIRETFPGVYVVMSTAYGDIDLAVESMKIGAIDFLVKPWQKEKLVSTLNTVMKLKEATDQVRILEARNSTVSSDIDRNYSDIISSSPAMERVLETARKVAATDANVMILGENGTGKELIARYIHRHSTRRDNSFIGVDLGSLPDSLFEAEMFGHARGAFTDAREERAGRFEIASGGSLFLDEIGNLSFNSQGKLLGAIQNRKITRLGSNREISLDIRLISATNRTAEELRNKALFREDLLYRINTIEIHLPPLRDRKEDILLLADHFLVKYSAYYRNSNLSGISREARIKMRNYPWPGNIRELQHTIERAVILSEGSSLKAADLMITQGPAGNNGSAGTKRMSEIEADAIRRALIECNGNQTNAAALLGYSRSTLYRKIRQYGL